ncbi:MAG: DUF1080 domain-containing protein [Planctomycetes bacterium]|nr:DUF1080 domain-containing protein [Planctomycetota bacterium]
MRFRLNRAQITLLPVAVIVLSLPLVRFPWTAGTAARVEADETAAERKQKWIPLFDGKSLDGWLITDFGGQGEVTVEDGRLLIDFGQPMSGITSKKKDFPKSDYEISLEAMRVDGGDFFCGLTFPVKESHCSFIVGGWAGSVVGISSIDGQDASENETTQVMRFENKKWYKIRVRVRPEKLEAWIDDKQMVDQDIKGRRISTRSEVNPSKPLGISTYLTRAAIRDFKYRLLDLKE